MPRVAFRYLSISLVAWLSIFAVGVSPQPQRLPFVAITQHPACLPGVGEIAFQARAADSVGPSNVELYTSCLDGSSRRRLTHQAGDNAGAVWSPDGRRIAFHSFRGGTSEGGTIPGVALFVMNADGSDVRRVIDRFAMNAAWSPDGSWLAFVSLPSDLTPQDLMDVNQWAAKRDIFVVRTDGTGLRNLTNATGSDNYPSWSPDGQQIAFSSGRDHGEDYSEIYVMSSDGTGTRRLTFNKDGVPGCCEDAAPAWSPDSRWLAFISKRDGNSEVYKMRRDGTQQQRLTRHPTFDGYPSWSADGEYVIFEKHRRAPLTADEPPRTPDSLYVVRADGSDPRSLGIAGTRPAWRWR